jgi:hypothetical protein
MERIFLTVIAAALLMLIGSATMLIYGTGHSAALLQSLPAQTAAKPSQPGFLPLGAATVGHQ